ncbi:hypothetical protein DPMN_117948 [Dreissena polymorpha]|uniref:Uncharacterized protein n=1 Tax=Dreissena polymorpha TaxID=45954 RepID=A0A9D4GGH2_DREPO|nr:hypothetical protein DPMN_117948 [Dreissena polymorpha]
MCTGTLQVNGADGNGTNAGGGSGGTMAITTPELLGSGKIEANGGQGKGDGGGGAGGRIAISITTKYVVVAFCVCLNLWQQCFVAFKQSFHPARIGFLSNIRYKCECFI